MDNYASECSPRWNLQRSHINMHEEESYQSSHMKWILISVATRSGVMIIPISVATPSGVMNIPTRSGVMIIPCLLMYIATKKVIMGHKRFATIGNHKAFETTLVCCSRHQQSIIINKREFYIIWACPLLLCSSLNSIFPERLWAWDWIELLCM